MKAILIQAALLWLAIVAEQARPDLIPTYALLLPLSALSLIANKSTASIVLVGVAMVLQDTLRMQTLPLVTVGVLVVGTFVVTRPKFDAMSHRSGSRRRSVVPKWFLQSAIIVTSGILLHFGLQVYQQTFEVQNLQTHLIVNLPIFVLSAAALRISTEFGFRFAID